MQTGQLEADLERAVMDLEAQMDQLRFSKLNYAVEEFRLSLQREKELECIQFQKEITAQTKESLDTVARQVGQRKGKLTRLQEDGLKQLNTYALLLQQLEKKKIQVQNGYQSEAGSLRAFKDRQQGEWKRNAQQFAATTTKFTI